MDVIELEHWAPDPEDPRKLKYAGQPVAQEVFEELKYRLENMGYLPDEYFLMNSKWENGREIPKGAEVACETNFGASEGIYIDVDLRWRDEKEGWPMSERFITGKTLGESSGDLDRMYLISSAITKAFCGGGISRGSSVISLNEQEQRIVVNALAEQRERQESALNQTEQLLRRMTGSITSYMNLVGQRPLHMSDSDRAVIAVRDGDLSELKELLPRITGQETMDALFLEAAGRPGAVGRRMTMLLLGDSVYTESVYKQACEKAVNIVDAEKIALLQEQAKEHTHRLSESFFGELAGYALQWHGVWFIAEQIMGRCSLEEILAAPSDLLGVPMVCGDMGIPKVMAEKGINGDHALRPFIKCRGKRESWKLQELLDLGMKVTTMAPLPPV